MIIVAVIHQSVLFGSVVVLYNFAFLRLWGIKLVNEMVMSRRWGEVFMGCFKHYLAFALRD